MNTRPTVRRTLCNRDCPDVCGLLAEVDEASGRVVKLRGDPEHPVTRGFLCYRTGRFLERQYSPDRLRTPLLRRGERLEPIGWDEALDLAADRLTTIRRESGPAAIFHYRSGGSLGVLKALGDYFFSLFGPVTTKRGDICSGAGDAAQLLDFGTEESHDLFDLLNARQILLWGKNPAVSSPHTLTVLRDARARGAELVLIDPLHTQTAAHCQHRLQPRPGGDFALAMAVARILFERGWTDPDAARYCDHLEDFRALAFSRPVESWCAEADISPQDAADLARRLGPDKPCAILVGWGMGRRTNGAAIVRALDALAAVSGNLGIAGGGVSFYFWRRRAFTDGALMASRPPPPRTVCEPRFGEEVAGLSAPPIRAVWISCGNPVAMLPDSTRTAAALRSREFVVVVDSFLTDTARLAHLVLPTTTLLEADDLLGSYGHHWIGSADPVVVPPPGVKSDLEIVQALAARVGLAEALAGDARCWKRRLLDPRLAAEHGLTLETLERGPVRNPLAAPVLFADRRFPTASGRVNLIAEPAPPSAPPDPEYPLLLMALSHAKSQCSQWAEPPREAVATVTVHPDAPGAPPDGTLARLESHIGSIAVRVRHDPRQRRDVALMPKGGALADGQCANALLAARTTDAGEGGALYESRVRLVSS